MNRNRTGTGTDSTDGSQWETVVQTEDDRACYSAQLSSGVRPSLAVYEAIDAFDSQQGESVPVGDRTPLYETIDADAMDILLADGSGVSVAFEYEEYSVTVRADRTVTLEVDCQNE